MSLDHLPHLREESHRFLTTLHDVDPASRVPSCPAWDAADLAWHLAEVQWFWATVVADRLQDVEGLEAPARPGAFADVLAFLAEQSLRLYDELAAADPATEVYMWSDDRTVRYIRRRQAHEALIHRVDAELTAGRVTAMDPDLASDGVHEALDVMFGGCPPWGTFVPGPDQVAVVAEDTGLVVPVVLGRFTGTDPGSGTAYDRDDLSVRAADPGRAARATVRGRAEDLDTWLWHRRDDTDLTFEGEPDLVDRLVAVLSEPID